MRAKLLCYTNSETLDGHRTLQAASAVSKVPSLGNGHSKHHGPFAQLRTMVSVLLTPLLQAEAEAKAAAVGQAGEVERSRQV